MLKITLYAEQKKRHRFIEQSFRLYGRRRGWDVSRDKLTLYISARRGQALRKWEAGTVAGM